MLARSIPGNCGAFHPDCSNAHVLRGVAQTVCADQIPSSVALNHKLSGGLNCTNRDISWPQLMCTNRFLQQGASATAAARTLRVNQALVWRIRVSSPNPLEFNEYIRKHTGIWLATFQKWPSFCIFCHTSRTWDFTVKKENWIQENEERKSSCIEFQSDVSKNIWGQRETRFP